MPTLEHLRLEGMEQLQPVLHHPKTRQRLGAAGVTSVLIATRDGLLVDAVVYVGERPDLEDAAAAAATALLASQSRGSAAARGHDVGAIGPYIKGGTLVVDPLGADALVAFVTRPGTDPGHIRAELRRIILNPGVLVGSPASPSPVLAARGPQTRTSTPEPPVDSGEKPTSKVRRLILKGVEVELSGAVATALVTLTWQDRQVVGKTVGRNVEGQQIALAAEATVRAVTEFLPSGYGVVLEHVKPVQDEVDLVLWAKVLLFTPDGEQSLLGIARTDSNAPQAAAKAVLSAVNRRVELVLTQGGAA